MLTGPAHRPVHGAIFASIARAHLRITPLVGLLAAAALGLLPGSALAGPHSSTTAAVSMGDSYISGEAGRWAGNSLSPAPGHDGTDRACLPQGSPACQEDTSHVYIDNSDADGCHRSDVAEIRSSTLPVARRINIACSGAVTANIFRSSHGGQVDKGEPTEADQLLTIARQKNVKLIFLSIGGNDFGFASIVSDCLVAYETQSGPCNQAEEQKVRAARPRVIANVRKAISEIQAVMAIDGYSRRDYRLIVQGYVSVVPRASENRYPESGPQRSVNGCAGYDADENWGRDHATREIGSASRTAARAQGVEFLNLADAFQGHEFCSKYDRQVTASDHPSAARIEWGRILGPTSIQQSNGKTQEVFHPDYFGQLALGSCVTGVARLRPGEFNCTGGPGVAPSAMRVTRLGSVAARIGCVSRGVRIGRKGIGRVRLLRTRGQLLRRLHIRPRETTAWSYSWCARRSRGRLTAVFSRRSARGRARLITSTVPGHRARGVVRGGSVAYLLARFPHARRVIHGVYRGSRTSRRIFGVRHGRVRFVGVADRRLLRHHRSLRRYLRRAGF